MLTEAVEEYVAMSRGLGIRFSVGRQPVAEFCRIL